MRQPDSKQHTVHAHSGGELLTQVESSVTCHRRYLGATRVIATMSPQTPVSVGAARVRARRALSHLLQAYQPRYWPCSAAPCCVLCEASAQLRARQQSRVAGTGCWVWPPAVQRLHPAIPTCMQLRPVGQPAHVPGLLPELWHTDGRSGTLQGGGRETHQIEPLYCCLNLHQEQRRDSYELSPGQHSVLLPGSQATGLQSPCKCRVIRHHAGNAAHADR